MGVGWTWGTHNVWPAALASLVLFNKTTATAQPITHMRRNAKFVNYAQD